MREKDVIGGTSLTLSVDLFPLQALENEKKYMKKLTLMFDLKLSDLILVVSPVGGIVEAVHVVRMFR